MTIARALDDAHLELRRAGPDELAEASLALVEVLGRIGPPTLLERALEAWEDLLNSRRAVSQ